MSRTKQGLWTIIERVNGSHICDECLRDDYGPEDESPHNSGRWTSRVLNDGICGHCGVVIEDNVVIGQAN